VLLLRDNLLAEKVAAKRVLFCYNRVTNIARFFKITKQQNTKVREEIML
jgi:hypothetical protein